MPQFIADQSERVDAFLARMAPQYSRSVWQKLCAQGLVKVGGIVVKANHKLAEGDVVNAAEPPKPQFSNKKLPILYQDDDVLVLNKPAGILTHAKGALSNEFTVADFVRPQTTDGSDGNRPGIVHRLDRDTSGVIIAAKNPAAKRWLQKQFSDRKAKKTYIALVHGHPKQPSALLQLPIERNPKKPQTFRVGSNGKAAETLYETQQTFANYTLLKLMPHTGRTHQLRVHMAYIGCPIVGDAFYGTADPRLGRLFLHAAVLELTLPSRERKTFSAPLPPELQKFLDSLQ